MSRSARCGSPSCSGTARRAPLVLYGAATIHVSLALRAVYERRTLRMPPLQGLRIALGVTMPITLIGHFIATRYAFEQFALPG